jgi:hypothetical protein
MLFNLNMFPVAFNPARPMHFPRTVVLVLAIGIVGMGLLFLRKWAALYFSVPLFWFGIQEAFTSIYEISFPLNLLAILHGISLTLPLIITIRVWRQLTWGGRFF